MNEFVCIQDVNFTDKDGNFKDGSLGCKHPQNLAKERDFEHTEAIGHMGIDMGIEMSFSEQELESVVTICKYIVGLYCEEPYYRHGKAFYKPYRNYYEAPLPGNELLDRLPRFIIKKKNCRQSIRYELTKSGLAWLGRQLKISIIS